MNTIKIIKNMGFDLNVIDNKQLRREFISLLEMFLDSFELQGEVYKKLEYTNTWCVPVALVRSIGIEKAIQMFSGRHIDESKHINSINGIDVKTNKRYCKRYSFDMIYDEETKKYRFIGYPVMLEETGFALNDSVFFIEYDTVSKNLSACRNFMDILTFSLEKYEFQYISDMNSVVASKYLSVYDSKSVKHCEESYANYFDQKNYRELYKSGEIPNGFVKYFSLLYKQGVFVTDCIKSIPNTIVNEQTGEALTTIISNSRMALYNYGEDSYYTITNKPSIFKKSLVSNILLVEQIYKQNSQHNEVEHQLIKKFK